jgi:hypothetical protein
MIRGKEAHRGMQRPRRTDVRIRAHLWLAILLLLQWSSAHAHCLRLAVRTIPDASICGVLPSAPADDGSPERVTHATSSDCPACGALSIAAPPQPPDLFIPIPYTRVDLALPLRGATVPPPARAPPQQPRAPPIPA